MSMRTEHSEIILTELEFCELCRPVWGKTKDVQVSYRPCSINGHKDKENDLCTLYKLTFLVNIDLRIVFFFHCSVSINVII